ncbi:NUDIX hydrolase [Cochlodiniinecator piscidefendens]|uniref:NUDIX hydrolase n=1 Tax=Cochlodiniinecator piscidefendens TaxID=2715756 RepID=UPI0014081D5D|nr:NUDIX hydrolase [Cochlodiniinecator piscidefendens]
MKQHPKLAALAVVLEKGKLLLVRRKNEPDAGLWGYPGGHVDLGETALAAAVRELREETTIIATPITYLTNVDVIISNETGRVDHHFLLAAVLCKFQSGTPTAQDDVAEAEWFDFNTVLNAELPMSKNVDTVLQIALQHMRNGASSNK